MISRKFVTAKELFKGFSDTQIEKLMKNMTLFMPMDGCPSPCDICAFSAKKTVDYVMDFSLIKHLYTNFSETFNNNNPDEHANDQLAYHSKKGEDFSDVLRLHKDILNYYPRVFTGFPRGCAQILEKILNMGFVSKNHPHENHNFQFVVPAISRHLRNKHLVDKYTATLEASDKFIRKKKNEEEKLKSTSYFLKTSRGIRELKVREIQILTIGDAKKYLRNPDVHKGGVYSIDYNPGVAVLPTGFYNFYGGSNYSYNSILKRKITPENFSVPERVKLFTYICRNAQTGQVFPFLTNKTF